MISNNSTLRFKTCATHNTLYSWAEHYIRKTHSKMYAKWTENTLLLPRGSLLWLSFIIKVLLKGLREMLNSNFMECIRKLSDRKLKRKLNPQSGFEFQASASRWYQRIPCKLMDELSKSHVDRSQLYTHIPL